MLSLYIKPLIGRSHAVDDLADGSVLLSGVVVINGADDGIDDCHVRLDSLLVEAILEGHVMRTLAAKERG